ncbi:peroxidase-like isoform X2 [Procambarus clarkii]|uniref:peroxidase-like isoform X2 n=1 Tax=Procambarus clarkii TaxID=6728 RepID=UPI0037449150
MLTPWALTLSLLIIHGVAASRESECIEVGFARAAGSNLNQGFDAAKEAVVARWAEEDTQGRPKYTSFSPLLKNVTRTAQLLEEASKVVVELIRKTRVGKRCRGVWLLTGLEKHVIPLINLDKPLAEDLGLVMSFRCMVGSPYPNVDGSCISQESPDLGSVGSKFLRLQPAVAAKDGFAPRESVNEEKTLPTARQVAQVLRKHIKKPPVTGIFSEWSHFIQRDIFSIPESPLAEDVDCCLSPEAEDCAPIPVGKEDPIYSVLTCINFRRSARAQAILGHRESFSFVSTYLDATPLYGPTDRVAFNRKTGYFGYLKGPESDEKTEKDKQGGEKNVKCAAPENMKGCFQLQESDDLIEDLKLLLVLEHNRLADALAEINPHFDDALLYNEARRILIAEYDHITYGEFLPVLMGKEVVKKHSLNPGAEGIAAGYIKEVNPGILNSFALAAYRNPSMHTEWQSEWGRSNIMESMHYNSIREDPYQDLLAMDVQRGRDHGLAGYRVWRKFCDGDHSYDSFEDLKRGLPKELVEDLKSLYQDELDDLDAQVALLEEPTDGGIIGKTYTCILADQFARLKTGNRLYWEHPSSLFTVEQKDYVKTVTLAHLLCSNLHLHAVPTNAFLPQSDSNPLVKCSDLPVGDLTPWKDTALIEKMKKMKAGQDKAGQDKAGQDKAGQDKAGQDKAGQDKAGQDKAGQDKAGQDKAGQDKAGQDKAGQGEQQAPQLKTTSKEEL